MLPFIALILAGAAQTSAAVDAQPATLPAVFEATCLDGQARLSATPIDFRQLPATLQKSLGQPTSSKVWQLNASGHSYLYILDYPTGSGVSPKICGLASDEMDLGSATNALGARVAGGVERSGGRSAQWLNAKDGYVATATTAAQFKVLQISWLSDAQKAEAMEQVGQLPH
jgi:hypothetical protein